MILNIYKELHWTSFDVVAKLRGILKTKKIGHAGTLDPLAEGVLIVLTDKDTKNQEDLMLKTKEYIAEIGFGISSETWDLEDLPKFVGSLPTQRQIETQLNNFIGNITQQIPLYSAKKVNGKELYKYARQGKNPTTSLPFKNVTVHDISIMSFEERYVETSDGEMLIPVLTCLITCSAGTYIRSIAHELGVCVGSDAVLLKLVRTKVGDFGIDSAVKVGELKIENSNL
jgi:tRNA pseudouridine55 synthase